MTTIRYARVKSTITDENSDDNTNQLQTIDSEDEDDEVDVLSVKIASNDDNHASLKHSTAVRNTLLKTVLWVGFLILCHYILSIGLTFYQRWLLKVCLYKISLLTFIYNFTS